MNLQTKKYKEYMAETYVPILLSDQPFIVDHRALKAFADSKGVLIPELSEEEKKPFLHRNPNYKKKNNIGIAAML